MRSGPGSRVDSGAVPPDTDRAESTSHPPEVVPLDERSELVDSIQLVKAAQRGDLQAYERLFGRYYLRVLQQVRQRLGPGLRRELDSQDVAQEAMVEAIRGFGAFEIDSRAGLIKLFAVIVENRLRTNAKRQHAAKRDRDCEVALRVVRDALNSGTLHLEPADFAPEPPELAARREGQELLESSLKALDERSRLIVVLRDYEGRSWEEIARALDVPTANAARMMHARVLVQLKKEMDRRRGR